MKLSNEVEFEFVGESGGSKFVATDQIRGVILRHLVQGQVDSAASLLATSAPEIGDALLDEDAPTASIAVRTAMAEMFMKARDYARAGRAALLLGDPGRAAPFFERSDQFERAAELYEKANMLDRAAELHERLLRWERAAQIHEQAGRSDRAAQAFERAGRRYEAGLLWVKLKRLDRAVEVLQQIERTNDKWVEGNALLGRVLDGAGHKEAAAARWVEVIKVRKCDAETAGIYERLAEIYLAAGDRRTAQRLVGAVAAFDPRRERVRNLQAMLGAESAPMQAARPLGASAPAPSTRAGAAPTPVVAPTSAPPVAHSPPSAPSPAGAGAAPRPLSFAPPADPGGLAPLVLPPPPGAAGAGGAPARMTAVHSDVDTLRNLPLFDELSLDELRALHAIGERAVYEAGAALIDQDREAKFMMVIVQGKVVVARTDHGRSHTLAELGLGAPLGEMALIDEGPTSARVTARTQVVVFRWPLDRLRQHLAAHDRTALRILRVMSRTLSVRLREANRLAKS